MFHIEYVRFYTCASKNLERQIYEYLTNLFLRNVSFNKVSVFFYIVQVLVQRCLRHTKGKITFLYYTQYFISHRGINTLKEKTRCFVFFIFCKETVTVA
jgi:hypothetical protein